jgi:hypothetical protein
MHIHLYGRNKAENAAYRTKHEKWIAQREKITGSRVLNPNVDSKGKHLIYRGLSPMLMGPVDCYREKDKLVQAVNVEVAWQYSKVYSHKMVGKKLVDISDIYIEKDSSGNIIGPTAEWFKLRDWAFTNPQFRHDHPQFKKSKSKIRRAFPKNSVVCFWYWNGRMLNRTQARQQIYATIYKRFLVKTEGYRWLKAAYNRSQDIAIFDEDGYDWKTLRKTPADCITDDHSFGHGHVIAMMLQEIDPTRLVKSTGKFVPTIFVPVKQAAPKVRRTKKTRTAPANVTIKGGTNGQSKLDWRKYDAYQGKQKGLLNAAGKANLEQMATEILKIHPADAKKQWGHVYAPGRYATVIHVLPGIRHGFGRRELGLKIFNQENDGKAYGPKMVEFHERHRAKLPGLPHPRVQEVIRSGSHVGPDKTERHYLIQKWIAGDTLDLLIERGITQAEILRVLDDLFLKIVIPLWREGVVWWDFRRNNMVFTVGRELHLIDSDALEASLEDMQAKPKIYTDRNRHTKTVMLRYRTWMLNKMLASCLGLKGKQAKEVYAKLDKMFKKHLNPVYLAPFPRDPATQWNDKEWAGRATAAYKSFRAELVDLFGKFKPAKRGKHSVTPSSMTE